MKNPLLHIASIIIFLSATNSWAGVFPVFPKTKLEKFSEKYGALILLAESEMATVTNNSIDVDYSSLIISVVEYFEPTFKQDRVYGVKIVWKGRAFMKTSYIDEDEILGIIKSMEYLLGLQRNKITRLDHVVANVRTKAGTEIWAAKGIRTGYGLMAPGGGIFYFGDHSGLQSFQQTLKNVAAKLHEIKR